MWETSASFTNPVEAEPRDDFGIGSSEVQARPHVEPASAHSSIVLFIHEVHDIGFERLRFSQVTICSVQSRYPILHFTQLSSSRLTILPQRLLFHPGTPQPHLHFLRPDATELCTCRVALHW